MQYALTEPQMITKTTSQPIRKENTLHKRTAEVCIIHEYHKLKFKTNGPLDEKDLPNLQLVPELKVRKADLKK